MLALAHGDYLRCICMNEDDYSTIITDIENKRYKTYYDVKFFPIDFLDLLQIQASIRKVDEMINNGVKTDERTLLKTFCPLLFGGKPMDQYDIVDLYVNNLGLKSVPSSDHEWILNSTIPIQAYYLTNKEDFEDFFQSSTSILNSAGNLLGDVSKGIVIKGQPGSITFSREDLVLGEHKNKVTIGPQ